MLHFSHYLIHISLQFIMRCLVSGGRRLALIQRTHLSSISTRSIRQMGAYGKYENRIVGNTGAIIFIPVYSYSQMLL